MPAPNAQPDHSVESRAVFATTHWSVVLAAGNGLSTTARDALETLARTYWYPLYAYVRRRGFAHEDAQDLTQSFFARLLEREIISRAASDRGRFRSFLLTALRNFIEDERERASTQKRGGGRINLSLDELDAESRYAVEPVEPDTPEKLFERQWAITVLDRAWERLAREYADAGKSPLFARLRAFGPREESPGYAEAARELKLPENTVKSLVHRMRQRYRALLRDEIAQTVSLPSEIDDEIRYLLQIISG